MAVERTMPADRSTREEVDARTAEVAEMMVRGKWSRALVNALAARWNVAPRTVRDYAKIASRIVWTGDQDDLDEIRASTIAKLEMLALKAENAGELRTAVASLAEMAKVAGIHAASKLELTGKNGDPLVALVATVEFQEQMAMVHGRMEDWRLEREATDAVLRQHPLLLAAVRAVRKPEPSALIEARKAEEDGDG